MLFARLFPAVFLAPLLVLAPLRAGTLVDLATPLGTMRLELFDEAKPVTVANFLGYVQSGAFAGSFAHRLEPGFVLQGGGYRVTAGNLDVVPTGGAILNEAGPFPAYSNDFGTIAMAKTAGNPNSATSQWFINLGDNSANLDFQNGGFTVFGRVVEGFDVLSAFVAFTFKTASNQDNVVVDVSAGDDTSPFTQLPVTRVRDNQIVLDDLIDTNWTIVPEPRPLLLVGIGGALLGLGVLRRQRRRSRA